MENQPPPPAAPQEQNIQPKPTIQPNKFKRLLFISFGAFAFLFIITLGTFGYIYSGLNADNNRLKNINDELETQIEENQISSDTEFQAKVDEYEAQIDDLEEENASLVSDKTTLGNEKAGLQTEIIGLNTQINTLTQKQANIRLYNDFLDYVYYLISMHGFVGFSEDEYNTARQKAAVTGNQDLVAVIDAMWYEGNGDPTTKFAAMMKEVIDGIYENL